MARVRFYLSPKVMLDRAEVLIRFYHSKQIDVQVQSHVFVPVADWDEKNEQLIFSTRYMDAHTMELMDFQSKLNSIEQAVMTAYMTSPSSATNREWLQRIVNACVGFVMEDISDDPDKLTLRDACTKYTEEKSMVPGTLAHYDVLKRMLERFEATYHVLYAADVKADDMKRFKKFISEEDGTGRSHNYIVSKLGQLSAVCNWLVDSEILAKSPFGGKGCQVEAEIYGDPITLTLEEVTSIYNFAMPNQRLETIRDIFIFQCYTGQRISDLKRMTYNNIQEINGALHLSYIQKKTIKKKPKTIQVPLSSVAMDILVKYNGRQGEKILPFISDQRYNDYIKEVLEVAGITRMVIILDSTSTKELTVRLCDIASSHMARRTFISSLYEITQEERITISMSGHAPHSSALSRYIHVRDSTKRKAISEMDVTKQPEEDTSEMSPK